MEQMLVHVLLVAIRDFTDAFMKEVLQGIMVHVDMALHEIK